MRLHHYDGSPANFQSILVWNNPGFGEIKKYMVERDIPPIGVDIYTPEFIAIAPGFGCAARTISRKVEFVDALLDVSSTPGRHSLI
jgi:acetolactate synthase-1/2/3 large subunit